MQTHPNCCNDNCNQGRDCPVRAGTHKPVQALHQIQEPAAAEQAAWHAGLDEGRAQAAPAAVAVPELQDMLRELRVQISAITVQLPQSVDCSGVWMAHDKMSAALAATPAAAPVELPEHWGVCVGGRIWIGKTPEHVLKLAEQEGMNPTLLFTEQQVRALLATGGQAQADLSSVIAWLEGGCDPKHAAAELRLIAGKAAPQQAVPHGWKLVPVEPTDAQLATVRSPKLHPNAPDRWDSNNRRIYMHMLAAAPLPPGDDTEVVAAKPKHQDYWICLLCGSSRPGNHRTLDDGTTPCPNKGMA